MGIYWRSCDIDDRLGSMAQNDEIRGHCGVRGGCTFSRFFILVANNAMHCHGHAMNLPRSNDNPRPWVALVLTLYYWRD